MSIYLKGFLENLQHGDGFLVITGWVCRVDGAPIEGVKIEIPRLLQPRPITLRLREDLVAADISAPAAFSVITVCNNQNVDNVSVIVSGVDCEPLYLNRRETVDFSAVGFIDTVDANYITGWLCEPRALLGSVTPQLVIAGCRVPIKLTERRPDLPYSCIGCSPYFGFRVAWSALQELLVETYEAHVRSQDESLVIELESSGVTIARKETTFPHALFTRGELELTEIARERTVETFHFYFDHQFYTRTYMGEEADVVAAELHYTNFGVARSYRLSPIIDPGYMIEIRPDIFSERPQLHEIIYVLQNNLCDPSPFFSLMYYKSQVKDLAPDEPILRHFLSNANSSFARPTPYFDLVFYRAQLGSRGRNLDDFYDFVLRGDREGLPSSRHFDPTRYTAECESGELDEIGPLEHYLRYGRFRGRNVYALSHSASRAQTHRNATSDWKAEFDLQVWGQGYDQLKANLRAEAQRPLAAFAERSLLGDLPGSGREIEELRFKTTRSPVVDIIIPAYNEFRHTLNALWSIALSELSAPYRVLLVDDASPDPQMNAFAAVPGLIYIRNENNLHFLRSCNAAFKSCVAKYIVLLNNDALLYPDVLQKLLDALEGDDSLGGAGPKVLYPNGRLQEAGCAILGDGGTRMIGVGDDPDRACYNYDRDVDYVSGACVMIRRSVVKEDLFDERFRPAYCEDTDLALRILTQGLRIRYVSSARVIHHLSVSTSKESEARRVQMSYRNQAKLARKWAPVLSDRSRVRTLSFYLPQFHPFAENDLWWGAGFTEWTNVARAVPSYSGHYQPHLPADLGYYDLRLTKTLEQQQRLARRYGLEGFVVYYYNFAGKRILWEPVANLLAAPDVDFRFCLCWANENWSKHWDGGEREILLAQSYETETLEAVCRDFVLCAADPRAITVNGKPLVLVYRPLLFPDIRAFADLLRKRFAEAGFPGVHLCYVESMEAVAKGVRPAEIGFDAAVEFPPQGVGAPAKTKFAETKDGWEGKVYDYEASVLLACNRPPVDYPRYPGVFPSWDNTPRQPLKATSFYNASPELFQAYVEAKVDYLNNFFVGEERLLFVNAWNEWAEGTHLEPDKAYGHAWLEALRNGIEAR